MSDEPKTVAERMALGYKLSAQSKVESDAQEAKNKAKRVARGTDKPKAYGSKSTWGSLQTTWFREMNAAFPEQVIAQWGPAEYKLLKSLVEKYNIDLVSQVLEYVPRQWTTINKKIFKGTATCPSIKMIMKLHENFFADAQNWLQYRKLKIKLDSWYKENPTVFDLPDELQADAQTIQQLQLTLGIK